MDSAKPKLRRASIHWLDLAGFAGFYPGYLEACAAEKVVPLQIYLGLADGRAFCLNLAEDPEAVRRAHARVGLPFDGITEVAAFSPQDAFLPTR